MQRLNKRNGNSYRRPISPQRGSPRAPFGPRSPSAMRSIFSSFFVRAVGEVQGPLPPTSLSHSV